MSTLDPYWSRRNLVTCRSLSQNQWLFNKRKIVASPSPIPSTKTYWKLTENLYNMGLFWKIVYSKQFLLTDWMQVFWVSAVVLSFPQHLHVHNDLCQPLLQANCACHRHDATNFSNTPKGKWGYLVFFIEITNLGGEGGSRW